MMQYEWEIKKIAIAASLALSLGACVPQMAQYSETSELKRNEVTMVRLKHTVNFGSASTLDALEQAAIEDFLAVNRVGYGDVLSLDLGDAGDPNAMAEKWYAVYEYLMGHGIHLQPEAPITGAAPASGSGVLIIERYIVSPPVCEKYADGPDPNWANSASPWFGCTTTALLGLSIADPADLINGNPDSPPDAEKAGKTIRELYRRPTGRRGGAQVGGRN
jgi:type IV pilus biogenesis protein CpaD/CtpE